ncbi:MAG TPA: response regulator [Vineibacter sp.]|nr:response regulator [Vineibacter sp.]
MDIIQSFDPATQAATRPRILLVEDEPMIRLHLKTLVERLGCAVIGPAADLADAIKLAGDADINAALLDVNLGGGDTSYPAARLLRARRVPFAFVTSDPRFAVEAAMGRCDFVSKPFRATEIAACLKRLLSPVPAATGA